MNAEVYRLFHILGLLMVFMSLGGVAIAGRLGHGDDAGVRRSTAIAHGIGLLLMLISGFGMLARLKYGFPGWVIVKMVIWLFLGGATVLLRKPAMRNFLWITLPLIGALAAYLAIYKPF